MIAPQTRRPSTLKKVFVGKDGLRAGWSALFFILIFAVLGGAAIFVILKLVPSFRGMREMHELPLTFGFMNEGLSVAMVLIATWIMARIERRGRSYGYAATNVVRQLAAGMGSGLVLISLLVFVLWRSGLLVIERRLVFGSDVIRYGVLWLAIFCLVGIFEESLTRGFLLYTLTRGLSWIYRRAFKTRHSTALGFWTAAIILSVIFFLGHTSNPGESPVGLLSVFLAGMFFCFAVWRSGAIWWAIGMHATWDWGQSFLFGVADSGLMVQHHLLATHPQGRAVLSGGTTGPEGSILIVGVLAVGVLLIRFTLPRGLYYEPPVETVPSEQPATAVA
ncbi:MAG TPA: CPBP family intramembrane glutamic endopeptidase [Candidatus Sulfotelmatobacter sp.]